MSSFSQFTRIPRLQSKSAGNGSQILHFVCTKYVLNFTNVTELTDIESVFLKLDVNGKIHQKGTAFTGSLMENGMRK